mgnify:CR=1 FL=1
MAITATLKNKGSVLNYVQGTHLDDAGSPAAKTISIGFLPTKVRWVNSTDRVEYEWVTGNANGTTLKSVANGTRTLDTADVAISVASADTGSSPVTVKGTYVVTIAAAAILQNKVNYFEVIG